MLKEFDIRIRWPEIGPILEVPLGNTLQMHESFGIRVAKDHAVLIFIEQRAFFSIFRGYLTEQAGFEQTELFSILIILVEYK